MSAFGMRTSRVAFAGQYSLGLSQKEDCFSGLRGVSVETMKRKCYSPRHTRIVSQTPKPHRPPVFLKAAILRLLKQHDIKRFVVGGGLILNAVVAQLASTIRLGIRSLPSVLRARSRRTRRWQINLNSFVDVYMSPGATVASTEITSVLLYVHGGAWGSGSSWNFSALGTSITDRCPNCAVLVLDYEATQYPFGSMCCQVKSVRDSLRFARSRFPNQKLICMGHSSGAHIATLALLNVSNRMLDDEGVAVSADVFISQAGVYDISSHFLYEASRGVANLSPLLPASCPEGLPNGPTMDLLSPSWHLDRLIEAGCQVGESGILHSSLPLEGHAAAKLFKELIETNLQACGQPTRTTASGGSQSGRNPAASRTSKFPQTFIQAALADQVVPSSGSIKFYGQLRRCGVDATLLLYDGEVGHQDFVLDWIDSNIVIRERKRWILDINSSDRVARQQMAKHVHGSDALTVDMLEGNILQEGQSALVRDVIRIIRALDGEGYQ